MAARADRFTPGASLFEDFAKVASIEARAA
jgi:hypothetical protein